MIAEARDFWDWWTSELTGGFSRAQAPKRVDRTEGTHEPSDHPIFDSAEASEVSRYHPKDRSLIFLGRHLTISLGPRRLPFSRARAVAMALATTNTPFRADQVVLLPKTRDMNAFALVRTDVFRPLLDEFKASGRRVTRLGLLDGSEIVWVPSRALEDVHPVFAPLRRRRNAGWAAAVLLVTAAAATYGHVFYRYEQAESKLAQVVETKTAEALAVRKLLDQQKAISDYAASVRRAKADAIPVVDVWEELTRRLPDDAWVTDMAVDRDSVALTGFARAAAGLIGEIGASDFLGEVAFTAPVVRMPDPGGERFELRARVRKP